MRARAILFDLDGTLADTLEDIVGSCNHVLEARGLPTHDVTAFRPWIGAGVHHLVREASGCDDEAEVDALVEEFRAHYAVHMFDRSRPYPGVLALLETLMEWGVPMAILSNKPHPATVEMVRRIFDGIPFVDVAGARAERPVKPEPEVALELAAAMGVSPERCLFVGDTEVDLETGRNAGMIPIGVSWGFRSMDELTRAGGERIVHRADELLEMIWNPRANAE